MNDSPSIFFSILEIAVFVGSYAYIAYSIQVMARKVGLQNTWLAWIPVANLFLLMQISGKPWWWLLLLLFVPIVNIVIIFKLWIAIAKRLGHSAGMGVLVTFVPLCIGFLAFSTRPVQPGVFSPAIPPIN